MPEFEKLFHDFVQKIEWPKNVPEEELKPFVQEATQFFAQTIADSMLKGFRKEFPRKLLKRKKEDLGFEKRCYRRWRKPLDGLELLWEISEEVGSKFNTEGRAAAVTSQDYKFDALVSLHARSLRVVREILCLLYGGFPDAALSRWRSLHELAVTAVFLKNNDNETSHRYLASFPFAALRAATQLEKYAERANMDPFSAEEMEVMVEQCKAFESRFDKNMYNDYGWASAALNISKPNFSQIEEAVSLDHWRPRYRWASQHIHAGYKPTHSWLGMSEAVKQVHLVGQSNSGFVDPIQMTAISLNQVNGALFTHKGSIDDVVFLTIAERLATSIAKAALAVEPGGSKKKPKRKATRKKKSIAKKKSLAKKR